MEFQQQLQPRPCCDDCRRPYYANSDPGVPGKQERTKGDKKLAEIQPGDSLWALHEERQNLKRLLEQMGSDKEWKEFEAIDAEHVYILGFVRRWQERCEVFTQEAALVTGISTQDFLKGKVEMRTRRDAPHPTLAQVDYDWDRLTLDRYQKLQENEKQRRKFKTMFAGSRAY
mmetsp:Transcript_31233/g.58644  ORF Transcript_31233/g.58644 Transcript_31233/m.58644 type:complete len:172 (-) Transcript_31233:177-692(-)